MHRQRLRSGRRVSVPRRRVAVIVGAALAAWAATAATLPASGASADRTVFASRTGLPASFTLAAVDSAPDTCSSTAGMADATHVTGPGTPPLGRGSLQLSFSAGTELTDSFSAAESALTTFKVADDGAPHSAHAVILADTPNGGGWELTSALPTGSGWSTTDVLADPNMLWWFRTSSASNWSPHGQGDYADFVAGDPGVQLTGVAITADTCSPDGGATLNVDDLEVGLSNATTVYDFEVPLLADQLQERVTPNATTSGDAVNTTATLTSGGDPISGASLTLWQRPAHTADYRKIAITTTDSSGVATAPPLHPDETTAYRWTFSGDDTYAPATADSVGVRVARKVTLHTPTSVKHGTPVVASGSVTPLQAHTQATLWRRTSTGRTQLIRTTVHRDGTYAASKTLRPGTYHLFVTVPADSVNTAGTSPTVTVVVRR